MCAFFMHNENSKVVPLAKLVVDKIESASAQFAEQPKAKSETHTQSNHNQTGENPKDNAENVKSQTGGFLKFVFPLPFESAGAFLSDQWWKVYQRFVLLTLAMIGLAFLVGPNILPKPDPSYKPSSQHNYEKLYPDKPEDNRYQPIGPGDVKEPPDLTPEIKSRLNPLPNPNHKVDKLFP